MKTKTFLFGIIIFFCCYSVTMGQNLLELHKKVMPAFQRCVEKNGTYNSFACIISTNAIQVLTANSLDEWIKIYENNDTLFSFPLIKNDYPTGTYIVITTSSKKEDILKLLMMLTEILPPTIGYNETMKILSPFFDEESSKFYLTELEKGEKKLSNLLLKGQPSVRKESRVGSSGYENIYTYSYTDPGFWTITTFFKGKLTSCSGVFLHNGNMESCADISVHNGKKVYYCGLFGCTEATATETGWIYSPISVKQFKKEYSSPF